MDSTTYLNRFQLTVGADGTPVALQRGPGGVTFRAEDIESDEPVALKLVPSYSFAPDELQQLETEARAAQQVIHPNIARLYDFGVQGSDVVFVTELLDGSTLDAWVAEHGPLPAAAVVRVALQVVSGLAAAAFHSVVHRAIQPASLMIVPGQAPDGEWPFVKVLNFGGVPSSISASEFASPEQLKGYPVDFRSEIYSLGCTMWFLLTGAPPAPGTPDKGGRVPRALRPILGEMVALDPMQRPQDPVRLQEQLRDALVGLERRETIGRTFGVATPPSVAAATTSDAAAPKTMLLLKPIALAAAALALFGIAAMAVPHLLRSRTTAEEPIGVPVGVPDAAASASAANQAKAVASNAAATAAPITSAPTSDTEVASANTTSSPATASAASAAPTPEQALVSSEVPLPNAADTSVASDSSTAGSSSGSAQPAVVAANSAAPSTGPDIQPAIPAEGTAEVPNSGGGLPAKSAASQQRVAQSSPDRPSEEDDVKPARPISTAAPKVTASSSEESEPVAKSSPAEVTRVAKSTPTPKPLQDVARKEVRRAEPVDDYSGAPPVPRGAKRAKYLGTTPEGDLIFGLPDDQRGYVAPPPATRSRERRARRAQPPAAPDPRMERVLPAEPVDPEELGEDADEG